MLQTSIFWPRRNFPIDRFIGYKFWQTIPQTLYLSQVIFSLHLMLYLRYLHYILQRKNQALLETLHFAQEYNTGQEFVNFRHLGTQPKTNYQVTQGLIVKKMAGFSTLAIPGNALGLRQKVSKELHTSPLGGHLGCLNCRAIGSLIRAYSHLLLVAVPCFIGARIMALVCLVLVN